MFYIEVLDERHIVAHEESEEGFLEVDDDIEEFPLYYLDIDGRTILKRKRVETSIDSDGRDVLFTIGADDYVGVEITYLHHIGGESSFASALLYLKSDGESGVLRLTTNLFGSIRVTCQDTRFYFEPISIDSEREVDNEHEPVIKVDGNHVTITSSVNYNRFRLLQNEIESIKQLLADSGLVVKNE